MCFTRSSLFTVLLDGKGVVKCCLEDLSTFRDHLVKSTGQEVPQDALKDIREAAYAIRRRWVSCKRTKWRFMQLHADWLEETLCLSHAVCRVSASVSGGVGRPSLPSFTQKAHSAKLKATTELRKRHSSRELLFSAASVLHQEGRRKAAKLVQEAGSPSRGPQLAAQLAAQPTPPKPYTVQEALALVVDLDMTKAQYTQLQQSAKKKGCNLYPPYKAVARAKSVCLPPAAAITVLPDQASVGLQALLDQTADRLLQLQEEVVARLSSGDEESRPELKLACKWGLDGSSSHSQYKQSGVQEDSSMFVVCVVPLRLETGSGVVVWENLTPSSPRFCRPVSVGFRKETLAVITETTSRMKEEIAALQPLRTTSAVVKYDLYMTMVDGKAINAVTNTSSTQTCSICGATPRLMNDLDAVSSRPEDNLQYGISSLHCWIRVMEALLRIAYRLQLRKKTAGSSEEKQQLQDAKQRVHDSLKDRTGLRVDEPRGGGVGNSNDGNTARRFFQAAEEVAACTGLDPQLIRRLHVVLQAVSSRYVVNPDALASFCRQTAELYVELYSWYSMPVTLHKLLVHSATVIRWCVLPIGCMSEEALESCHKQLRKFRLKHTRKDCRLHSMSDLFGFLLVSSDPLLSSLGLHSRRHTLQRGRLLPETRALLSEPLLPASDHQAGAGDVSSCSSTDDSSDSDSSD